jgi:hypothetical protein
MHRAWEVFDSSDFKLPEGNVFAAAYPASGVRPEFQFIKLTEFRYRR